MFDTKLIPMYVSALGHKLVKVGKDKITGTEITLKIDPLTPDLAAELDAVKGICFKRTDGEVNPNIDAVSFTHNPKPQTIELYAAPDVVKPSLKLSEGKIGKVKARKTPVDTWVLSFKVTLPELSGQELLYLKDALFEQRWFTFYDAQGGLFTEAEAEAKREAREAAPVRKSRGNGSEESATAH